MPRARLTPTVAERLPHSDADFAALARDIRKDSLLSGAANRFGGGAFEIIAARVVDGSGRPSLTVEALERLEFQMLGRANDNVAQPNIGLEIYDRFNQLVYAVSALNLDQPLAPMPGGAEVVAAFRIRLSLQPGQYTFVLVTADQSGVADPNTGVYHDRHHKLGPITVTWSRPLHRFYGMTALDTELDVRFARPSSSLAPASALSVHEAKRAG